MESIFTQLYNEPNADVQCGLIAEIYGQMSKDIFGEVKYQKTAKLSKASFLKALDVPKLKSVHSSESPLKEDFKTCLTFFIACIGMPVVVSERRQRVAKMP